MYSWVASVFQDGLTAFCPQFVPRKFAMKLSLSHVIISYVEYTKTIIPYLGPRGLYTNELAGSCQRLNTCITKIVKSKSIFFFFVWSWVVRTSEIVCKSNFRVKHQIFHRSIQPVFPKRQPNYRGGYEHRLSFKTTKKKPWKNR